MADAYLHHCCRKWLLVGSLCSEVAALRRACMWSRAMWRGRLSHQPTHRRRRVFTIHNIPHRSNDRGPVRAIALWFPTADFRRAFEAGISRRGLRLGQLLWSAPSSVHLRGSARENAKPIAAAISTATIGWFSTFLPGASKDSRA
jgi:hypothetical protein